MPKVSGARAAATARSAVCCGIETCLLLGQAGGAVEKQHAVLGLDEIGARPAHKERVVVRAVERKGDLQRNKEATAPRKQSEQWW